MARPEDGDDPQAPRMAHRARFDVHARQAAHAGGHRLGRRGNGRRHRREERPAARELGPTPPVSEEAEVPDPDEAAREQVEQEAAEELRPLVRDVTVFVVLPPCQAPSLRVFHLAALPPFVKGPGIAGAAAEPFLEVSGLGADCL